MYSVLKNKIGVWKLARSNELIIIQCQLCLVKLGGLRPFQAGCSCADICNEHKAKADMRWDGGDWWFNLAIPWRNLKILEQRYTCIQHSTVKNL